MNNGNGVPPTEDQRRTGMQNVVEEAKATFGMNMIINIDTRALRAYLSTFLKDDVIGTAERLIAADLLYTPRPNWTPPPPNGDKNPAGGKE